jgi:ankyrin repeat protein
VNNNLQYPLHLGSGPQRPGWQCSAFSVEIINSLVRPFPLAARLPGQNGTLPLHKAASYARTGAIKAILDAFPDAIHHQTNNGNLPLHSAC